MKKNHKSWQTSVKRHKLMKEKVAESHKPVKKSHKKWQTYVKKTQTYQKKS